MVAAAVEQRRGEKGVRLVLPAAVLCVVSGSVDPPDHESSRSNPNDVFAEPFIIESTMTNIWMSSRRMFHETDGQMRN